MQLAWRALAALAGAGLLELLGVPAGALLGAVIGAGTFTVWRGAQRTTPTQARWLALALLGWVIGAQTGPEALAAVPTLLGPLTAVLAGLAVCAVVLTVALVRWAGWDPATALLAAAPGGIGEMAALSVVATDDAEVVTATHLARLALILIAVPLLAPLLG